MVAFNKNHPDFLCIGLPKTGTTWLYVHLKKHPEIWLPPIKEISYLWGHDRRILKPKELWKHRKYVFKKKISYLLERIKRDWSGVRNMDSIFWDLHYALRPQTISWYRRLFASNYHLFRGDISPQYHAFGENELKKMQKLNPSLKIIIFLRDPVDRLWSFAKMKLKSSGVSIDSELADNLCIQYIDQGLRECPNYWKMIQLWKKYFPAVFIAYYDDLQNHPEDFFNNTLKFLGVSERPNLYKRSLLENKIWSGNKLQPPKNIESYLIEKTRSVIEELYKQENHPYVGRWMNRKIKN